MERTVPLWFGPYGRAALDHAETVATHGANAAWFHEFDGSAFEICARYGLAACVEFKTFRADFNQHPELIPIGVDGKPIRFGERVQGVCLSQKEFLEETEARLRAGVRTYQPAGVWLDYLTYAGWFEVPDPDLQESCFCAACVAEFCEATGIDADDPAHILAHHQEEWTAHKCERIAAFGRLYAGIISEALPGCVVGAYMCPWRPDEFGGALRRIFAQDFDLLAESIDVFTPLIYAEKSGRPPQWAAEYLENAPAFVPSNRKVQLILDALDFPDSMHAASQAATPSWGVQMFGGAKVFADRSLARVFAQLVADMRNRIESQN